MFKRDLQSEESGFSILEFLVAIVLIGILSTAAVFAFYAIKEATKSEKDPKQSHLVDDKHIQDEDSERFKD